MKNIIEMLYFVFSEENNVCDNSDYRAAYEETSRLIDDIEALLPKEKREMLDELYSSMSKMMFAESKEMFAGGFKTAMKLFIECAQ